MNNALELEVRNPAQSFLPIAGSLILHLLSVMPLDFYIILL